MIPAWRIVKARNAGSAFSGDGARLTGGRWNSRGTPLAYTSASESLATLEIVVHLGSALGLQPYVLIRCEFDEGLVTRLDCATLPPGWRTFPAPPELATIGDAWAASSASAVLAVPSVVIPSETNYLLNPQHAAFGRIRTDRPVAISFDPRLTGSSRRTAALDRRVEPMKIHSASRSPGSEFGFAAAIEEKRLSGQAGGV